jgi:NAD(P)H-nitrite reductase large subunit
MAANSTKNYNIVPGIKMGFVTPEQLVKIAQVTEKYKIPALKITSAQRLAFIGMDKAVTEQVWQDLGEKSGPVKPVGIHYIQACPGSINCKYGQQDSQQLGEIIQNNLMNMDLPAKAKVGISGCPMNCTESYVRDLGIFGKKKGWTLIFGGNGGGVPRIGDIIAENLSTDEVVALAKRCLQYYAENGRKRERTARFMERTNLDDFIKSVTAY